MYPARFRYEAPRSLDEAVDLLRTYGDDAKVLAGGQSLIPMVKLRFATPADATWYLTTLSPERRSIAAETFRHYLSTAAALRVMRSPGAGVPPSKFRPPVYVTLWSS